MKVIFSSCVPFVCKIRWDILSDNYYRDVISCLGSNPLLCLLEVYLSFASATYTLFSPVL